MKMPEKHLCRLHKLMVLRKKSKVLENKKCLSQSAFMVIIVISNHKTMEPI